MVCHEKSGVAFQQNMVPESAGSTNWLNITEHLDIAESVEVCGVCWDCCCETHEPQALPGNVKVCNSSVRPDMFSTQCKSL